MNALPRFIVAIACAILFFVCEASMSAASASERLASLFQSEWETRLKEDSLMATLVGVHSGNAFLPDMTIPALERRTQQDREWLKTLRAIPRSELTATERVSRDLFEFSVSSRVRRYDFGEFRVPFTSDSGFYTQLVHAFERMPLSSPAEFEVYLKRLGAIPDYLRQNMELMQIGLETRFTMPQVVMAGILRVLDGMATVEAEKSPFYLAFDRQLSSVPNALGEEFRLRCQRTLSTEVLPAYRELATFAQEHYSPQSRTSIGARHLPDGQAYYRFLVHYFTTLDISPEDVHEMGLKEVSRIRSEMDAILAELDFQDGFAAFLHYLRTDSKFYASSAEQLLKEAAWIAKRIDGVLPAYFGQLPRMPYGVAPVPEHLAPNYTTGRYSPGVPGGDRGGYYWVNTFALEKRPLYALPALTLHEAMPGHHLQIALAQELQGLPEFRKHFYPNAFGEGWALYAEKLGKEMGVYRNLYEEFGRLTYEMWRAGRLVVDTGIHFKDWTREQAVQLFVENTALSLHNIETEVDRYISWPGQALSYKMGELTIVRLRERAEKELGPRFDLRAFHDAVLRNGGVTLSVLEDEILGHIRQQTRE